MTPILDVFPFPWHEPGAQQLHVILYQLHPTSQAAGLLAAKVGIQMAFIDTGQAPAYVWKDILDAAAADGSTRQLVKTVNELLSANNPRRPFFEALLADQAAPVEAEPRGPDSAPRFIKDTDDISEPEALLYYDDLTIQIGRVPRIIATLQRLVALAPAVCRLVVDVHGTGMYGTGFRIGSDLLLSNYHVFHRRGDGVRATAVTAEFGYEDDGRGGALGPAAVVPCDVATFAGDIANDWAVIRTKQPLADAWPILNLSEAVAPTVGDAAYIIQHPGGERKRIGFVRNQVSFCDDRVVHYLTDTREGSSGSPVFDAQGRLIALHHAGGRPQEIAGKPPVKKNEGIRISRVVEGLKTQHIDAP